MLARCAWRARLIYKRVGYSACGPDILSERRAAIPMAEIITCTECQRKLQVPESFLGQKVQCPECGHHPGRAHPRHDRHHRGPLDRHADLRLPRIDQLERPLSLRELSPASLHPGNLCHGAIDLLP